MTNTSRDQQPSLFDDADLVTMVLIAEPIRRETAITAAALIPGDIVLTRTGDRDYAAFDVDVRGDRVTVWTATTDQAKGIAPKLQLVATDPVVVARKTTGRIAVR